MINKRKEEERQERKESEEGKEGKEGCGVNSKHILNLFISKV